MRAEDTRKGVPGSEGGKPQRMRLKKTGARRGYSSRRGDPVAQMQTAVTRLGRKSPVFSPPVSVANFVPMHCGSCACLRETHIVVEFYLSILLSHSLGGVLLNREIAQEEAEWARTPQSTEGRCLVGTLSRAMTPAPVTVTTDQPSMS